MTSPTERGQGGWTRLPNGRYRVSIVMPDGTRVWRRARTEAQAERIRRDLAAARELDLDPSRQTLSVYLRMWIAGLRDARNQRIRPRTLDHYQLIVEKHIIPGLDPKGRVTLTQLNAGRIQAWLDADPGSPRTVHHHHAVLRRALNVAVRHRVLAYNPALAVELPEVEDDVARPLTREEARCLLEATAGDWYGPLWRLALATGLRQGELLGLARDDVQGNRVTIRGQLQRLATDRGGDELGWAITDTKAARRLTTIRIGDDTAAALEAHKVRQAAAREPEWRYWGLLFVTPRGMPIHQAEVGKAFKRACVQAGIATWVKGTSGAITPALRFHDLRHTNMTLQADAGVPEEVRMNRAGHSTTAMARHYAQASEAQDQDAAERIEAALSG